MQNVEARARKLGVVARVAAKQVSRSRAYGAISRAVRATSSHTGRVLGQLWLEVTGFVFLCLAGIGAIALVREYVRYQAGTASSGRVGLALAFTVMFGWFGLSSFWRVRKKK
ncbi:MAG TPA: hypothetical protein VKB77_08780 [Terriglobales bacterium]|nr:hypothetical protein [Terriglobales bacterium]